MPQSTTYYRRQLCPWACASRPGRAVSHAKRTIGSAQRPACKHRCKCIASKLLESLASTCARFTRGTASLTSWLTYPCVGVDAGVRKPDGPSRSRRVGGKQLHGLQSHVSALADKGIWYHSTVHTSAAIKARQGQARQGQARQGKARQGKAVELKVKPPTSVMVLGSPYAFLLMA